jgi:acetylornithine aminotransferase
LHDALSQWAKINAGLDPFDQAQSIQAPTELVSFNNCFHGRTMGALALTYKQQYKTPFLPIMGDTKWVPAGAHL